MDCRMNYLRPANIRFYHNHKPFFAWLIFDFFPSVFIVIVMSAAILVYIEQLGVVISSGPTADRPCVSSTTPFGLDGIPEPRTTRQAGRLGIAEAVNDFQAHQTKWHVSK